MQIPRRHPHPLRRVAAGALVLLACALPLAACDTDASDQPPTQADLREKGCC